MNPHPGPPSPEDAPRSFRPECDSPNAVNFDFDGPVDNTIRPCRPERRAALEAERELLRRWAEHERTPRPAGNAECDSLNVVNFDFDGPVDNTIRPCRPERRAALEAERELLRRWTRQD